MLTLLLTLGFIPYVYSSEIEIDDRKNETLPVLHAMTEQEFEKYKENPTAHPELDKYPTYNDFQVATIEQQNKQRKAHTKKN